MTSKSSAPPPNGAEESPRPGADSGSALRGLVPKLSPIVATGEPLLRGFLIRDERANLEARTHGRKVKTFEEKADVILEWKQELHFLTTDLFRL